VNPDALALRNADDLYSKGAAANNFRSLVPRVNVMQSLPRFATLPFVIPAVAGGVTAAAGAATKAMGPIGRAALGGVASAGDVSGILAEALRKNKKKK
jgi:hypothetical protein